MKFKHPLMHNNFSKSDFSEVKKLFNKNNPILTQANKVREFEKKWSQWLGVKYSTFVSSGSSANFITISLIKALNKKKYKNEIIVPSLTWISDISSIILNGLKPICKTLLDLKSKNKNPKLKHVTESRNKSNTQKTNNKNTVSWSLLN